MCAHAGLNSKTEMDEEWVVVMVSPIAFLATMKKNFQDNDAIMMATSKEWF